MLQFSDEEKLISRDIRKKKRILGLGVACVDIIACVNEYPKPDEKIRADSVQLFSGGNVGNTLTAISKLGAVESSIVTKVGKDSNGDFFINDLISAGVDVSSVVTSETAPTLLVYVIVDKQACRTCIASPNEEELTIQEIENMILLGQENENEESNGPGSLLDDVEVSSFCLKPFSFRDVRVISTVDILLFCFLPVFYLFF